jgi:hypothetical protein
MFAARAERAKTAPPSQVEVAARWTRLDRRQRVDLLLPGAMIGLLGGIIGGGLTAIGGLPFDVALVSAIALAVPLTLVGAFYDWLLCQGRIPLGPMAPASLIWFVGFPVGRCFHAAVTDLYAGAPVEVPHGWAAFVVYQVLVSVAFSIGFWWLHENFAPRWWFQIRPRNPVADHFVQVQLEYVVAAQAEKVSRRQRRRNRMQARRGAVEPEPGAERRRPRDRARAARRDGAG